MSAKMRKMIQFEIILSDSICGKGKSSSPSSLRPTPLKVGLHPP